MKLRTPTKGEVSSLNRRMAALRRAIRARNESEAVRLLVRLTNDYPFCSPVLTLAACILQLTDNAPGGLSSVHKLLERAHAINPYDIDGLEDLAQFLYAVANESKKAVRYFCRLEQLGYRAVRAGAIGRAKCLIELGRKGEARAALRSMIRVSGDSEIKRLLSELKRG